jgi:hypothetical protein
MVFQGKVSFRSSISRNSGGPPGEAQVLALNPHRRETILQITGWAQLEAGSLNIEVIGGVVDSLMNCKPILTEPGESIKYPPPYENIPKLRGEYYYFTAIASANGITREVLVRRAKNPVPGRLELFAAISLKKDLAVGSGDIVFVTLTALETAAKARGSADR